MSDPSSSLGASVVDYMALSWKTGQCVSYIKAAVEVLCTRLTIDQALSMLESKPSEAYQLVCKLETGA